VNKIPQTSTNCLWHLCKTFNNLKSSLRMPLQVVRHWKVDTPSANIQQQTHTDICKTEISITFSVSNVLHIKCFFTELGSNSGNISQLEDVSMSLTVW